MMLKLGGAAAAALVAMSSTVANAATLDQYFEVSAAYSVPFERDVSLWVDMWFAPDLRGTYVLQDAGEMRMMNDGTATITGRAVSYEDSTSGFDIDFHYDSVIDWTPEFKHQFGSIEHGNESYIDMEGGVLRGFGRLAGLDLTVTRMPADGPYATQMGGGLLPGEIGANNHSTGYGLANWFFIESVLSGNCELCAGADIDSIVGRPGDLNVELTEMPAPVPLPAAGLLALAGLGSLVAMRRRTA